VQHQSRRARSVLLRHSDEHPAPRWYVLPSSLQSLFHRAVRSLTHLPRLFVCCRLPRQERSEELAVRERAREDDVRVFGAGGRCWFGRSDQGELLIFILYSMLYSCFCHAISHESSSKLRSAPIRNHGDKEKPQLSCHRAPRPRLVEHDLQRRRLEIGRVLLFLLVLDDL
jgi:hypothetical protein